MRSVEKIREGLYVKKSFDGYRVVHPYKNDDGTTNWKNVFTGGSYWNLLKLLFVVGIIFGMVWSYQHDVGACIELQENICDYLPNITDYCTQDILYPIETNFNFSFINFTENG